MFKQFKDYIIGEALTKSKNVFDHSKINMFFNISFIYIILYLAGSTLLIINEYWYLLFMQISGIIFVFALFIALKRTKHYQTPAVIWILRAIYFSIYATIISGGEFSYINICLMMMNIAFAFLLVNKAWALINLGFYMAYATISILISYQKLPPIDIGVDFSHDRQFFERHNIAYVLFSIALMSYIFYSFMAAEKRAKIMLKKQEEIAISQQATIRKKNRSINDSINYAFQIQKTILADLSDLEHNFDENFLLFKPKEKLSGDLYWIKKVNGLLYISVVDTSENGIPGALFSFICHDGLNMAINTLQIITPSKILKYLNEYLKSALTVENRQNNINVSLFSYDTKTRELVYAGDNSSIFVVTNNDIIEYRGRTREHNSVAINRPYKDQTVQLNKNDTIYIFSDGYANQFTGMKDKRFKQSVFKQFLLSIHYEFLTSQRNLLDKNLKEWIGKDTTQSDDICVMGIKVK